MSHRAILCVCAATAALGLLPGCEIDPFCINCSEESDASIDGQPHGDGDADADTDSVGDTAIDTDGLPDTDTDFVCTPGAEEICNGRDDNCDGVTDEGFDLMTNPRHCGRCNRVCELPHAFNDCDQGECVMSGCDSCFHDLDGEPETGCEYACCVTPTTEVPGSCEGDGLDCCDGLDNDCDGEIDEDHNTSSDPNNCGGCTASCEGEECEFRCDYLFGIPGCDQGACFLADCVEGHYNIDDDPDNGCEYACTPNEELFGAEQCNSRDDDCDGDIDEDFDGMGDVCGEEDGQCEQGTLQCDRGAIVCQGEVIASAEVCDGEDNDCDGDTDEAEDIDEIGNGCGTDQGICSRGVWACTGGQLVCDGGLLPGTHEEECNNLDDDCDGFVDNGIASPGECGEGRGACVPGQWQCEGGRMVCVGAQGPVLEECNNVDDDCDGDVDEEVFFDCSSLCGPGERPCVNGAAEGDAKWGECSADVPEDEICDGLDNDCDGFTDEDVDGDTLTEICTVGDCVGERTCIGAFEWSACSAAPRPEECNGLDDNCNDEIDEGVRRNCETLCGFGEQFCVDGDALNEEDRWGPCSAREPAETEECNGIDDDCDDETDTDGDGGPLTRPCSDGPCEGIETCTSPFNWTGCTAESNPEICNNEDDDCDDDIDEGFDTDTDPLNCGECGRVCEFPNAVAACIDGECEQMACDEGWWDTDLNDPGCDYECELQGVEVCNGIDDDCDREVDTDWDPGPGYCGSYGVCEGATVTCEGDPAIPGCDYTGPREFGDETLCDGLDNDCDGLVDEGMSVGLAYTCDNDGTGRCFVTGHWECADGDTDPANRVCVLDEDPAPEPGDLDEICNGLDDDCDGDIDEGIALADFDLIHVTDVDVDLDGDEEVRRQENNRDFYIFRHEASHPDATGSDAGTIHSYACSQPPDPGGTYDPTLDNAAGVMPWTAVAWRDAQAACCGLNAIYTADDGDGITAGCHTQSVRVANSTYWDLPLGFALCNAEDWEVICQSDEHTEDPPDDPNDAGAPYVYPYGDSYEDFYCNGFEAVEGEISPSGAHPDCTGGVAAWGEDHFDMSGNVMEWTFTGWFTCACDRDDDCTSDCDCDEDCWADPCPCDDDSYCQLNAAETDICSCDPDCYTYYEYRGGSYGHVEEGLTCQFDFNVGADRSDEDSDGDPVEPGVVLENLGFRCCYYPEI